ncbi:hypothetical protein HAX54_017961 [Datura stramonium]|uniref:Uncharacterized protein n=1 Tax=Datura stramonium TaxID=4076 RepID=A0ABS8UN44_DATST|nr:hypothetical protein [Datura stramonium]
MGLVAGSQGKKMEECGGGDGMSHAKEGKGKRDIGWQHGSNGWRTQRERDPVVFVGSGGCGVILGLLVLTGRWNEGGCVVFSAGVHGGIGVVSGGRGEWQKERELG